MKLETHLRRAVDYEMGMIINAISDGDMKHPGKQYLEQHILKKMKETEYLDDEYTVRDREIIIDLPDTTLVELIQLEMERQGY